MIKPEKFGHLHLVYHYTVPLNTVSIGFLKFLLLAAFINFGLDSAIRPTMVNMWDTWILELIQLLFCYGNFVVDINNKICILKSIAAYAEWKASQYLVIVAYYASIISSSRVHLNQK